MSAVAKSRAAAKVSRSEYREAVAAAELVNIRLIKSEFTAAPEAMARDNTQWKQSFDFTVRDVYFDPNRSLLTALLSGEAICKVGRKKIVGLRSRYVVAYRVTGSPAEAAATTFARRVAEFAAYPYFRAHFSEVCSQAGIILPPLPIIKEPRRAVSPPPSEATVVSRAVV